MPPYRQPVAGKESIMDRLQCPVYPPLGKVAIDCFHGGKSWGSSLQGQPVRSTYSSALTISGDSTWPASLRAWGWNQRLEQLPLRLL